MNYFPSPSPPLPLPPSPFPLPPSPFPLPPPPSPSPFPSSPFPYFEISSGVNSLGSVLSIPNFFNLRSIGGANFLAPFLSAGQRRRKRDSSVCWDSWKTRASIWAATRLLAAVMAWISPFVCGWVCQNRVWGVRWEEREGLTLFEKKRGRKD